MVSPGPVIRIAQPAKCHVRALEYTRIKVSSVLVRSNPSIPYVQDFLAMGQNTVEFGRGEGNVEENPNAQLRSNVRTICGNNVVVLDPHNVSILVDFLIQWSEFSRVQETRLSCVPEWHLQSPG